MPVSTYFSIPAVLQAGTLTDGVAAMSLSATMPTTIAAARYAFDYQITSAGSSSFSQVGVNVDFLAGYTGSNLTQAGRFVNAAASTGTNPLDLSGGNLGNRAAATATTNGTNVGSWCDAQGGNLNYGALARAITAKNSATNIGVAGFALNTGTSPVQLAGFFGLMATVPTFTSAALMCDNGATTSDIFVARDNGTAVFSVLDGGTVKFGTYAGLAAETLAGYITIKDAAGNDRKIGVVA